MRKELVFIFAIMLFTSLVIAQDYKLEISTIPEDKVFESGETIQLKVIIYDSENNLIQEEVLLILKDLKEAIIKEMTIKSGNFGEITLPEDILSGEGEIIVKYKDTETTKTFFIGEKELVKFGLQGEKLIVTNIGNTKYQKKIYISIGETTGTKTPNLNIGESVSYRLIAPEGVYNIKISDGVSKSLTTQEVRLTGTGQVIGALDSNSMGSSGITGGIKDTDEEFLSYAKKSKFVYVFILTIFGAMILLAIERRYRKKAN